MIKVDKENIKSADLSIEEILNSIRGVINANAPINSSQDISNNDEDIFVLTETANNVPSHSYTSNQSDNTEQNQDKEFNKPILNKEQNHKNKGYNFNNSFSHSKSDNNITQIDTQHSKNLNNYIQERFSEYLLQDQQNKETKSENHTQDKDINLISKSTTSRIKSTVKQFTDIINKESNQNTKVSKDKTIENLVIEVLQPQLSKWLENHLFDLVKSILEQEIKQLLSKSDK